MIDNLRSLFRSVKNRRYASPDDLYRKRTRFGELNEFFKYQVIASDRLRYSPPFLGNPMRAHNEKTLWRDEDTESCQGRGYEYQPLLPAVHR